MGGGGAADVPAAARHHVEADALDARPAASRPRVDAARHVTAAAAALFALSSATMLFTCRRLVSVTSSGVSF